MTKESKHILRLRGQTISKNCNIYTEELKHQMIQELLSTGSTKAEIWRKYTGYKKEHGLIAKWMLQLGYTIIAKKTNFASSIKKMQKKKVIDVQTDESFENLQLRKRVEELEKQFKDAEMKAIAFSTMVDIAEKEFNIPIRKKFNTKPSK